MKIPAGGGRPEEPTRGILCPDPPEQYDGRMIERLIALAELAALRALVRLEENE